MIREALKTRKREDIFIAVKFGGMLTPDDRFYGIDVRPQNVQNYLAYTLKRLGTDMLTSISQHVSIRTSRWKILLVPFSVAIPMPAAVIKVKE